MEPALEQYDALWRRIRHEHGHDQDGGHKLGTWLLGVGFCHLTMAACYVSIAEPQALRGTAETFVGLLAESWGETLRHRGWATAEAIHAMSDAWRKWAQTPGAFFAGAWCEAVARKEGAP